MSEFKKEQVIMLESHTLSNITLFDELYYNKQQYDPSSANNQHLYIISDDKIKGGDWVYNKLSGIGRCIKNEEFNKGIVVIYNNQGYEVAEDIKNCKKIIAATDTSLKISKSSTGYTETRGRTFYSEESLPQLPQQFIEEYIEPYNKGAVITDVLVEYESKCKRTGTECGDNMNCQHMCDNFILKINPKVNTISIKKLKDSWNREELQSLFKKT